MSIGLVLILHSVMVPDGGVAGPVSSCSMLDDTLHRFLCRFIQYEDDYAVTCYERHAVHYRNNSATCWPCNMSIQLPEIQWCTAPPPLYCTAPHTAQEYHHMMTTYLRVYRNVIKVLHHNPPIQLIRFVVVTSLRARISVAPQSVGAANSPNRPTVHRPGDGCALRGSCSP